MAIDKPYVWQMVREAVDALGGDTTNTAIRDWILEKYPGTNTNTIQCQIIVCTVNHASRIHYPENKKPRTANGSYDFLFRPERGRIELFDPTRHGEWEIVEKDDGTLGVTIAGDGCEEAKGDPEQRFAAEDHLRDYLAQHLDLVEKGLQLFVDDDGNAGVEYQTPIGRIDILAVDASGGLVAIELKVSRGPDAVAGQILRYKNWIKCHLADGKPVRGIIIAQHITDKIRYAIMADDELSAMEYSLSIELKAVGAID